MPLTLVPIDLGQTDDVSPRAKAVLEHADLVIVEDFRQGSTTLKHLGLPRKDMELLNEHSRPDDIQALVDLCRQKNVALISDCGTPNFCDPGAALIRENRKAGIAVRALPGPSSLALVLSLSSERLTQFLFVGFLPPKTAERRKALADLRSERRAFILMDTPYRVRQLLTDLAEVMPKRKCLLAMDLTLESECVLEGAALDVAKALDRDSAEFMLLVYSQ